MNFKTISYIVGILIAKYLIESFSEFIKRVRMKERNLMEELHLMLEKAMKEEYEKLLIGRPARKREISKEDIVNLKIALNNATSLEEFLNQV